MLIVLLVLTFILMLITFWSDDEEFVIIPVIIFIVEIIALVICVSNLVGMRTIDNKIELYNIQNKEIEEKISIVVKQYMDFESETFKELKSDSYINLVALYPELKSDTLVQQQITLYTENNNKIIELKEKKLNKTIYKWWVYFGK